MRTDETPPATRPPEPGPGAADDLFFREWRARRPGDRRSLDRARALLRRLGPAAALDLPVLTVVGSKGKGTAATYASAWAAAAGLRVLTVTSPGLRSNRERLRLDGAAVSEPVLRALAARLCTAMEAPSPHGGGYLSPAGLFTLAGLVHARSAGADVIVLEAGMGGAGDEAALVPPTVLAITSIFGEHLGVLGDTAAAIAREKAAIAAPTTRAVLSAPQPPDVAAAVAATAGHRTGGTVGVQVVRHPAGLVPADLLPSGLNQGNALLGSTAAHRLLEVSGLPGPSPERLGAVLSSVTLPGRCSHHVVPGTGGQVALLADCAIDRVGVAAALRTGRDRYGGVDHVLLCLPDHKDLPGAAEALGDTPVTFVRLPDPQLRFERALPPRWQVLEAAELTRQVLADRGRRLAVLGTVYFVGRVLDLVEADTERLFVP